MKTLLFNNAVIWQAAGVNLEQKTIPTSTCGILLRQLAQKMTTLTAWSWGRLAANAAATITAKTAKLNNGEEVENEDDDPFAYDYEEDETTIEDE